MASSSLFCLDGSKASSSTSTTTSQEYARMQASRLSQMTPGSEHVSERLVNGSSSTYDHVAAMRARLAAIPYPTSGSTTSSNRQ
ncbi:hypothetical protein F5B20DRAFT_584771 [Whalleya microplaca]|nr:hypothetical protein F5B20DRAFT_584771 [Whalleya microplaca]